MWKNKRVTSCCRTGEALCITADAAFGVIKQRKQLLTCLSINHQRCFLSLPSPSAARSAETRYNLIRLRSRRASVIIMSGLSGCYTPTGEGFLPEAETPLAEEACHHQEEMGKRPFASSRMFSNKQIHLESR